MATIDTIKNGIQSDIQSKTDPLSISKGDVSSNLLTIVDELEKQYGNSSGVAEAEGDPATVFFCNLPAGAMGRNHDILKFSGAINLQADAQFTPGITLLGQHTDFTALMFHNEPEADPIDVIIDIYAERISSNEVAVRCFTSAGCQTIVLSGLDFDLEGTFEINFNNEATVVFAQLLSGHCYIQKGI